MAEEKTTESLHKDVNDSTEEGVQSVGTLLTQIIEEIVDPDEIDLLDEVSLKTTEYDNSTAFIIATDSIEVPRWLENHQNKKKSEELNESTDDDYDVLQEVDEEDALDMVLKSADDTTDEIGVTSSNATSLLVCRICHGSESVENYVSPCKCKGTLSKVHKTCLEHWLAESDTSYCELCGHEYITERVPQYSLLASVYRWATCSDSWRDIRDLLVDLVVMCIFTPMIVMGTYAGIVTTENLYRLDLMASSIQIPMTPTRLISLTLVFFTATMDLVYTSWMIVRFQHHFAQWHRWWRRKCMVRLVIEKNDKQLAEINQEQESGYTFD